MLVIDTKEYRVNKSTGQLRKECQPDNQNSQKVRNSDKGIVVSKCCTCELRWWGSWDSNCKSIIQLLEILITVSTNKT